MDIARRKEKDPTICKWHDSPKNSKDKKIV